MRPTWLLLSLGLLTSTGLSAHPISPHAQKAVETIRQLRLIGLPCSDDLENGPPAKVPGLLRMLNQELKAIIIEDLNDHGRHAVASEDEILEQLTTAGWEEIPSHRAARNIRTAITTCRKCGMTGLAAPPHVRVRVLILALSRFEIASRDKTRVLEKDWAIYRKNRRLTGEGKVVAEMPESCPH